MATTQTSVSHVWPLGTTLDADGVLQLGGCDARELARAFGTPAYVVVEDDLRTRARRFLDAFAARTRDYEVHFASKSFPATAVLRLFADEGLACDVASGGELHLALNAGFRPDKVHLHGNAKSNAELQMALDAGIGDIVVDNLVELDRLIALVPAGRRQRILLRVAPGVSPDTHPKISTGGPNTKFGFNLDDAAIAIERAQRSDRLDLDGLHFHIGSQILDLAPFRAALEAVARLGDFRTYNMGGGLGVAYTHEQSAPEIEDYVARKVSLMHELLGPDKRIADEPGRALVAHSTVTLYSVESVKHNVVTYVATDGGMSDNLRPMLYDARYEAMVVGRPHGTADHPARPVHLAGKHCESSDVLIHDVDLPDPQPGDLIAVPVTGAYGHAMANNYNGQPRPPIVFVGGGEARTVVRRETYEDLTRRDVG
ncbi:Diaminopimelate decarboxylase [Baekduia alba]|uniref:diaminopimelate decarboxylase n=1 Tax=Baekduia alba TaxID=2997333 RepID=UPI00233FD568|nr:diaminopimelate decarboxylase [Baekduia alba]WCB95742.1 Diaminopimelate decarboxylase [Baekduia alba]